MFTIKDVLKYSRKEIIDSLGVKYSNLMLSELRLILTLKLREYFFMGEGNMVSFARYAYCVSIVYNNDDEISGSLIIKPKLFERKHDACEYLRMFLIRVIYEKEEIPQGYEKYFIINSDNSFKLTREAKNSLEIIDKIANIITVGNKVDRWLKWEIYKLEVH